MGTALITGATAGIGLEFAWQLAAEGNDLVLVARNEQRLAEVAAKVSNYAGNEVEILPADLATEDGARAVGERCADRVSPIGLLVNNAGFGLGQPFASGDLDRELDGLDVMARAVLITCHYAAAEFTRRGYGAILNVSSMTALTAQGTYSAHKAWVRTFTEALAASCPSLSITATCPGLVHTEFHERSEVDAGQWPDWAFIPVDKVVSRSLDAVRRGRVLVTPSPLYQAASAALRLAPRSVVRAVAGPGRSGI